MRNGGSPTPAARRGLRKWLKSQKPPMTQKEFAHRVGITVAALNDILQARRNPSLELAARIESESGVQGFVQLPRELVHGGRA
jgi:transcriptional regulator with XRE-family HTH domain